MMVLKLRAGEEKLLSKAPGESLAVSLLTEDIPDLHR